MLAGLLFAIQDADDRPDTLVATLPIGGLTLLEFQARLLVAAGAAQIVVLVGRVTPELSGAINRIARRGVAIDAVRSASEAAAKVHPLATLLMLGDGLVTTGGVLSLLAEEGPDALLVTDDEHALPGFERVGVDAVWAGIARLDRRRLADAARMPRDYDLQSLLLRVAAQTTAEHEPLPDDAVREGHGLERRVDAADGRNRRALATHLADRNGWTDRALVAPLARLVLGRLKPMSSLALAAGAGGVALAGALGIAFGWLRPGLLVADAALLAMALAAVVARLHGEDARDRQFDLALAAGATLILLLVGYAAGRVTGTGTAPVLAVAGVLCATLAERARIDPYVPRWWATPLAYPLVLLPFVLAGRASLGLAAVALYALATLTAAIERLRKEP